MNDPRYHDALETIAERGHPRGADAVLTDASRVPVGRPAAPPTGPRRGWARPLVVAATAAALVVGALALIEQVGGDQIASGTTPPAGADGARLVVASGLPPSLVPDRLADEGEPGGVRETGTMQHFTGTAPGGGRADLTVFVTAFTGTMSPTPERVRGVDGFVQPSGGVTTLGWLPRGARVWAWSATLDLARIRAVVEALGGRGDDALAGFDAPPGPVDGTRLTLVAEHVSTPAAPPPAYHRISYRDPADNRRGVVVDSYAPVSGASLDLVTMWPPGERRVVAGTERVVRSGADGWTTVSWILPDGAQAVVRTRGLTEAELDAVVGGVGAVDTRGWERLQGEADDARRTHPPARHEADLAPGRLRAVGSGPLAAADRQLCLDVAELEPLCGSQGTGGVRGGAAGALMFGPSGPLHGLTAAPATEMYTASRDDRWFLFGTATGTTPEARVDGSPLTLSVAAAGPVLLYAVEIPAGAGQVEMRFPESRDNPVIFSRADGDASYAHFG